MVWHRLPSFLPNFTLKLLPLSKAQQKAFETTGYVREVAFRTAPSASKPEIKQILERLYGLRVVTVRTLNAEGKKKRGKHGYYRTADYKKAYVTLDPPAGAAGK